ncbi:hypothetical protein ACFV9E_30425 [Streptomyces sp. NPDC059835]|uniref:hypothetical protein n=1 Tax=Streptomyces sp. NPDC059835 TaxID=3346967 RepID=UPI0036541041
MQLDPENSDSPVLAIHMDAFKALLSQQDELAVLVDLSLHQAYVERGEEPLNIANPAIGMLLAPKWYRSAEELKEAYDRLVARGFVQDFDEGEAYSVNPLAARVLSPNELSARFRMAWNSAKVRWNDAGGPRMPRVPEDMTV